MGLVAHASARPRAAATPIASKGPGPGRYRSGVKAGQEAAAGAGGSPLRSTLAAPGPKLWTREGLATRFKRLPEAFRGWSRLRRNPSLPNVNPDRRPSAGTGSDVGDVVGGDACAGRPVEHLGRARPAARAASEVPQRPPATLRCRPRRRRGWPPPRPARGSGRRAWSITNSARREGGRQRLAQRRVLDECRASRDRAGRAPARRCCAVVLPVPSSWR